MVRLVVLFTGFALIAGWPFLLCAVLLPACGWPYNKRSSAAALSPLSRCFLSAI